ncbi:unnamed protein product [Euphydryas editha]|uniref:Uncharacterized protein n=1 Tax=Euphydryas editha TaxID=104508 RepID=A0AAU9TR98_EUPED|nr:unnamed protein product [Euphydryas editha]
MNEYQAPIPEIQVPKEWPVDGIENIVKFLLQDAINCHQSGKKFVMTVDNVPAVIKDNRTRPGYIKKIKEIEYLPMNLKCDHPIAKLVSTNPDRHIVMTIIPDVEKILLLKGITGSEKYNNYTIRTTYRVHNIKWLDDIM